MKVKTFTMLAAALAATMLLGTCVASATIISSYTAPGDPTTQGWTYSSSTVSSVTDPTRSDINETPNVTNYDAWQLLSVPNDKGYYFNTQDTPATKAALEATGWTATYVARTMDAPSAGYHSLKVRDKTSAFQLYFVKNSGDPSTDGVIVQGAARHLIPMDLADDYHTFQMTIDPTTPGSFSSTDVFKLYVDGAEAYSGVRGDFPSTAFSLRTEIADDAVSLGSQFAFSSYTLETGVNVIPEPTTACLLGLGGLALCGVRRRKSAAIC